jgi:hypothetical protein
MCLKEARKTNDLNARPIELEASALHAELNTLRVNESFSFEAPVIVFFSMRRVQNHSSLGVQFTRLI